MIIDWYTVIFQIINFLVLVFLLRYFLYGPIIKAMDEREEKIVEREEQATTMRREAEDEAESYRKRSDELRKNEESTMEKARQEAEKEKANLLDKARKEVEEARRRWTEAFDRDKESFTVELRRRITRQACAVARRCLEDLADLELEKMIRSRFLVKLKELPSKEQSKLNKALGDADYRLTINSAFSFPKADLKKVEEALSESVKGAKDKVATTLNIEKDLVCGLELEAGGYRLAWSVDDYLVDVEEQVLKGLEQTGAAVQDGEEEGSDEN